MKKIAISTAALTAAAISILTIVPSAAGAVTAKAEFNAMKQALISRNKQTPYLLTDDRAGGPMYVVIPDGPDSPGWTLHNGRPVINPDAAGPERQAIKLAVNESSYSRIEFGSSHNILLLTPKADPQKRYEVKLDQSTHLPISVKVLKLNGRT